MIIRPDYKAENETRKKRFKRLHGNQKLINSAKEYYKTQPIEFIKHWCVTYDPRNVGTDYPTLMPFILFKRQEEFIQFLHECLLEKENGANEKCRDMGATWCAGSFSVWLWLFHPGCSVGWGSRKEQYVDKLGDPDSIFEKLRLLIKNLPSFFKPDGYIEREHSSYMKILNPENNATITGEAGDNIGRGGRKTIYFKDESAHYLRPELIEASLGDNTDVQIDISSVNGPATVFQRRVDAGETWEIGKKILSGLVRVFIFDWKDNPLKDQAWYDKRRAKAEREGLLHKFAQEVDRDASASVEGTLIPSAWIKAAIDSHVKIGLEIEGKKIAALDVADEGKDKHALAFRKGILLKDCFDWHSGDVGQATQKALFHCREKGIQSLQYDSIGVGAGVKSETNRIKREIEEKGKEPENESVSDKFFLKKLEICAWNAASSVLFPKMNVVKNDRESPKNKDFYKNLKAQGYWQLRIRFEKTYKVINQGASYDTSELISLSSDLDCLHEIEKELTQPTFSIDGQGKMLVDKSPDGAKSPNKADAIMMCYWPKQVIGVLI